jgi:hypothetical protein
MPFFALLAKIFTKLQHWPQIEEGAFDGLVRLRVLDVRDNFGPVTNASVYTTRNRFDDSILDEIYG